MRDLLSALDKFLNVLAMVCKVLTGLAIVVLTVIFGWLVYGRYVLNATPTWVEQLALLLVMTIAFIGAAVGVHENTHLSVTLIRSKVSTSLRRILLGFSDAVLLVFGALMFWYGFELTLFKWGSDIPLLRLPEGLRSLPLCVSGALIVLFSMGHLIRLLTKRDLRTDTFGAES